MSALFSAPAAVSAAGLTVLAALILLRRPLARILRLAVRCAGGLAALSLIHPVAHLLGITVGVNGTNALVLALLGVPGFGLLLMLQWVFR